MRVLGIDPGLRRTGYGVIDCPDVVYVASGCVLTNSDADLALRLKSLFESMQEIILKYSPDVIAIEKVFVNTNPHSSLLLGQARGALFCAGIAQQKMVHEYTALQVKQAVVGYGKAAKIQVSNMVCRLLKLAAAPSLDAADALACAICHAHSQKSNYAPAKTGRRQKIRWQSWPGQKVD